MIQELHEAFDDRETAPQAFAAIALRVIEMPTLLKNIPMLVFRDTPPGIPHLNPDTTSAAARTKHNFAAVGVAHRVGDKVAHNTFEKNGVTSYKKGVRRNPERKLYLTRRQRVLDAHTLHQRRQRNGGYAGPDDAGVQPRNIEQRIEKVFHDVHGSSDVGDDRAPVRRQRLLLQSVHKETQRV